LEAIQKVLFYVWLYDYKNTEWSCTKCWNTNHRMRILICL
jgi:hypothetical protein